MTNTKIKNITGFVGNFKVTISKSEESRQELGKSNQDNNTDGKNKSIKGQLGFEEQDLKIGAITLATGFELYNPKKNEFGFNKFDNVITNMRMENILNDDKNLMFNKKEVQNVVYIQCVGSRGPEGLPECSRYCCQAAIKQSIALRKKGIQVTIFERDIRVYHHEAETMYRQAREMGVTFIRFKPGNEPKLIGDTSLKSVQYKDKILGEDLEINADLLVLSVGMRPAVKSMEEIQHFLKVPTGMDGFLLEKHPKFGPIETNIEGVFIAGCVQGPKDIADSISQANAVAAKIDALLARSTIWMEPIKSEVNEELCRACGSCIEVCEYDAIELQERNGFQVAHVNEALCKGCGTCAPFCDTGAIDIRHFRDQQIEAMLDAFLLD